MTTLRTEECSSCHYFHGYSSGHGDCRRYPPVYVGNDSANERHRWKHPLVCLHHWCGEYQKNPQQMATGDQSI